MEQEPSYMNGYDNDSLESRWRRQADVNWYLEVLKYDLSYCATLLPYLPFKELLASTKWRKEVARGEVTIKNEEVMKRLVGKRRQMRREKHLQIFWRSDTNWGQPEFSSSHNARLTPSKSCQVYAVACALNNFFFASFLNFRPHSFSTSFKRKALIASSLFICNFLPFQSVNATQPTHFPQKARAPLSLRLRPIFLLSPSHVFPSFTNLNRES